jgi:hypothetical protein
MFERSFLWCSSIRFCVSLILQTCIEFLPQARPYVNLWWYKKTSKPSLCTSGAHDSGKKNVISIIYALRHLCIWRATDSAQHWLAVYRGVNIPLPSLSPTSQTVMVKRETCITLQWKCILHSSS